MKIFSKIIYNSVEIILNYCTDCTYTYFFTSITHFYIIVLFRIKTYFIIIIILPVEPIPFIFIYPLLTVTMRMFDQVVTCFFLLFQLNNFFVKKINNYK